MTRVAMCPPQPDFTRDEQRLSMKRSPSSNTTNSSPSPPGLNSGRFRIAGRFLESHWSASAKVPSWEPPLTFAGNNAASEVKGSQWWDAIWEQVRELVHCP